MLTIVPLISALGLHKTYRKNAEKVEVLRGLDLEVFEGEFVSVLGASGSGKSTMLHLLGTLDRPDHGEIYLQRRRIDNLPGAARDELRNGTFGFIFQFYHLLPELNTLENILMPQMIKHSLFGWLGQGRALRRRGTELLERVGLSHRLKHRPRELSGGEMQRAAIARALINRPRILLADEPTGNLDAETGAHIIQLLRDLNRTDGLTIIMVTHNLDIIADTDRVVRLVQGRVEGAAPKVPFPAYVTEAI
ncbi:MAG TPA: ABC transporter ATP-binding protein [Gemmataceae bacterium]|nr:ABC transporter ATP-binding protein [Gemmataceae bacterium]